MFGFFSMLDNYDDRKIERHEDGDLVVSTCYVSDSDRSIETAIRPPLYNEGSFVVVQTYDNEKDAQRIHAEWVQRMTADPMPSELVDVGESDWAQLARAVGGNLISTRG